MYFYKIILLFLISSMAMANHPIELEQVTSLYLKGFDEKNKNLIKESTTPDFYASISEDGILDEMLAKNKLLKSPAEYQFKVNKQDNDIYIINAKLKQDKEFGDYWYQLKKINNKWLIFDTLMLENANEDKPIKKK